MATPLPPTVRRVLRAYRFAHASIALAEAIGLGALLVALLSPACAPLALLWFAWRLLRRPQPRAIAAAIEHHYPSLAEKLTAAIELAGSADPPPVQGSPELIGQLLAEVDRDIAVVDVARLFSLKPVAVLLLATLVVNLTLLHQREQQRRLAAAAPDFPAASRRPGGEAPASAVGARPLPLAKPAPLSARGRLGQLQKIVAALQALPENLQRALPPGARSLAAAVNEAERAATAAAGGNLTESQALEESVAETLSEFARLARQVPELTALADQADALARDFAAAAVRTARLGQSPVYPASTNTVVSSAAALPAADVARLPAAPAGPPWRAPVTAGHDRDAAQSEPHPPQYEQPIRHYFERLAGREK